MDDQEIKTFQHHDKISKVKAWDQLMVCEPVEVVDIDKGGVIKLAVGSYIRVTNGFGGVTGKVAIAGKIHNVALQSQNYHCVELESS